MKHNVQETFNVKSFPDKLTVEGKSKSSPFVPEKLDSYVFREDLLRDFLAWWKFEDKEPLFLTGPTGSGKTSLPLQVCARMLWPVQVVSCHSRLEFPEMVGGFVVTNGNTEYHYGPLATAMKEGHLLIIDEYDLLDPGTASGLNTVLEGRPLVIPENGGEIVQPHADFRVIVTGNTAGVGDSTGMYQGTMQQNLASVDRFWIVHVDYPQVDYEKEVLLREVSLPEQVIDAMLKVAWQIRESFKSGESDTQINIPLSTRSLVRWAKLTWCFHSIDKHGHSPLHYALDRAIGFKAEPEVREALHEIVQRYAGE